VQAEDEVRLAVWQEALAIGRSLPVLPLFLRGGPCIRIDLETTYERTWQEQGMPVNGALASP
jgi:hypothetical protein